ARQHAVVVEPDPLPADWCPARHTSIQRTSGAGRHTICAGTMIVKVLGSAAGGGFPQWNCNCRNCADVRRGARGLEPRTQSSVAVSIEGQRWALLSASPDLRQQIAATPELNPSAGNPLRSSPIDSVVLTNADVDHIAGLLNLR